MKKFLMGAAAVLLALGGLLTGCTNGDDDDDGTSDVGKPKILQSIDVDYSQAQTVFTTGTTFSAEGLVVRAYYEDNSSREVSLSNCTFKIGNKELTSGETKLDADVLGTPNNDTNGTYTVTVSYKEKEDSYNITMVTEVVLARIAVDASNATTTFTVGNTFSAEGLVVTAYYSNGTSDTVTGYTLKIGNAELTSGETELTEELLGTPNAGTDDTYTVTVSYTEGNETKTAIYTIKVEETSLPDGWTDAETLVGIAWWDSGNKGTAITELAAQEAVTYTFKVEADGADCMIEAYDSTTPMYYLSTTSQKTGWTVDPVNALTNAGEQTLNVLKAGNIYSAKVEYDGTKVTITYTDLGTDGNGTTELFTTATTGTVTAPVHAHLVAQVGTFIMKTDR